MVSGNQHSRSAKRNCCTNSVPYGYGGLSAETIVFPVRIIMSPTCSNKFFVGRKARSANALTTWFSLLPMGDVHDPLGQGSLRHGWQRCQEGTDGRGPALSEA